MIKVTMNVKACGDYCTQCVALNENIGWCKSFDVDLEDSDDGSDFKRCKACLVSTLEPNRYGPNLWQMTKDNILSLGRYEYSLLEACELLHTHTTHSSTLLDEEQASALRQVIMGRVADWHLPSCDYDNVVKMLCERVVGDMKP